VAKTAYIEDGVILALLEVLDSDFLQVDRNGVIQLTKPVSEDASLLPADAVDKYLWDVFSQEFSQKLMKAMSAAFSYGNVHTVHGIIHVADSQYRIEASVLRCGEWETIILLKEINEIQQVQQTEQQLKEKIQKVEEKIKTISGLLPMCSCCKKIRDEKGFWEQLEVYIQSHTNAQVTHTMCPTCEAEWYK